MEKKPIEKALTEAYEHHHKQLYVFIWSKIEQAYWRPQGEGYTNNIWRAGLFFREEAERIIGAHKYTHSKIEEIDLDATHHIRSLSWKQPYGDLMFHDKIETRVWDTKYRGKVLICSSKVAYSIHKILEISGQDQSKRIIRNVVLSHCKNGVALGIADLVDSRPMKPADEDACFVEYKPDLSCHVYQNPIMFNKPFPWKGNQGWKTLQPMETMQVMKALQDC